MADKTDGGPAFPQSTHVRELPEDKGRPYPLRDYLAGQALTALILRPEAMVIATAQAAYSYADAMLAERAK